MTVSGSITAKGPTLTPAPSRARSLMIEVGCMLIETEEYYSRARKNQRPIQDKPGRLW
jgi:hypothetical protein